LAKLWFFIMPFTCRSSTAITWFSFTIRRDSLWRWSFLAQATRSCARATRRRALSRLFEPFFLRDRERCLRFKELQTLHCCIDWFDPSRGSRLAT
jgi:hypothetical protein